AADGSGGAIGATSARTDRCQGCKDNDAHNANQAPRRSKPERGAGRELLLLGAPERQWPLPTLLWALVTAFLGGAKGQALNGAAAEVVTRAGGSTAGQPAAVYQGTRTTILQLSFGSLRNSPNVELPAGVLQRAAGGADAIEPGLEIGGGFRRAAF